MNFNIILRIMPSGNELDLELPAESTGREVIEAVLDSGEAPRADKSGMPHNYQLVAKKGAHVQIGPDMSLFAANVQSGDILIMMPMLEAGFYSNFHINLF